VRPDPLEPPNARDVNRSFQVSGLQSRASAELDWLSQALSGRGLVWTINTLVIVSALLLFAVVFLSVTGELPRWPLATASAAATFVAGLYWGFFRLFGKSSPGERLARLAGWNLAEDTEEYDARFR
jgi:CHASE2 domain-containing sensor protein